MELSRKAFLGGSLMAAAGCMTGKVTIPRNRSDYEGVQIGVITYSYRQMPMSVGCTLRHAVESGMGTIELMSNDLERDIGAPFADRLPWKLPNDKQAELIRWRKTVDLGLYREIRRRYDDAGVAVHIVKFPFFGDPRMEEWEIDYCFRVTRMMGALAMTCEVPSPTGMPFWKEFSQRLRSYTGKYGVKIAFHNHTQINATTYDGPLLEWNDDFRINFDIGHYVAGNDDDPLEFVKKYHDRIFSIHLKDRTTKAHGQKDLQFGKGDTPLGGLFALLRREGWDYPCDIEMEYAIPDGSDAVREVIACNSYCRNAILG